MADSVDFGSFGLADSGPERLLSPWEQGTARVVCSRIGPFYGNETEGGKKTVDKQTHHDTRPDGSSVLSFLTLAT